MAGNLNTGVRAAAPGLSRLAQALGGQDGYQQGYDQELSNQSRMAQAISAARANDARAAQDSAETQILQSRPQVLDESAALSAGTTLPIVRQVQEFLRTGARPMNPAVGPADEAGNAPMAFPAVDDATQSRVMRELQRLTPMRTNLKDTNVADFAKAAALNRTGDLSDQVLAGTLKRDAVAGAQAASEGKAQYHFDESGLVGDLFGGGLNESSGRAGAVTNLKNQQAAQAKAGAAENYAQAERARREGVAASMSKPFEVTGPDGNPVLVQQDKLGNIAPVSGYTPKGGTAKPLPPGVLKQITEVRDNAATINRLSSTFKPEFAGKGLFGLGADAQMTVNSNTGRDRDAVEWWKNYRKQSELVERHAMFGASLTPGEQASWRSADVSPGMDPRVVERNLATRSVLTKKMFENTRQDLVDAGHSEKRIGAIADRSTDLPANEPAGVGYDDAEKERRYQKWKAGQK